VSIEIFTIKQQSRRGKMKNRKLTKKELLKALWLLKVRVPEKQTEASLFASLVAEIQKPPFPPPPGSSKK